MIAECRAKKAKEEGNPRLSSHSTEQGDDQLPDNHSETNSVNTRQMTANIRVGGKMARVLLDTGTAGTNLMSSNWAQANQMPTTKMQQPCEIRMATKNS